MLSDNSPFSAAESILTFLLFRDQVLFLRFLGMTQSVINRKSGSKKKFDATTDESVRRIAVPVSNVSGAIEI